MIGTFALLATLSLAGCASLPPAANQPKSVTTALDPPADSPLTKAFQPLAMSHGGDSGFRMVSTGIDGLTARVEMIDAAHRSLDVQSYIFRADESGNLIVQALLRAADRGVRIRILVDDGESVAGDEKILSLSAQAGFEVRLYNPLSYRGHNRFRRDAEFLFNKGRVDYRMHNKLMVADNVVAIIGGRNIGNQYFQIDPTSQFGDDDLVVAGPVVPRLSAVFDEFWNSPIVIPAQTVDKADTTDQALVEYRALLDEYRQRLDGKHASSAEAAPKQPFLDIMSGRTPLHWGPVKVVYDSPDKKDVGKGHAPGRLIYKAVEEQANAVSTELLMVTPYFVPSSEELTVLKGERERHARVRILTNSLEAAPSVEAQSGYMHHRVRLLQAGVELYEVRALLGSTRGSGQGKAISRHGNYGLHAKLYVFDRKTSFVGSLNFDQRSKHLNTEIGLMIGSTELSGEIAARFEALTQLDNSYAVTFSENARGKRRLLWTTQKDGTVVHYEKEPARSSWQRVKVRLLAVLPLDREL
ncbi:MAG: phospholipase D family protein [Pseudomonadota bacterium]|nr:phospholipase D family protein [Pseudomonadota bacterium]